MLGFNGCEQRSRRTLTTIAISRRFKQTYVFVLAGALLASLGATSAHAAPRTGEPCKKVGVSVSQKKSQGELLCLNVAGARRWVSVPEAQNRGQAVKLVRDWQTVAVLPNEHLVRHFSASSDAYVSERLALAQQARDQLVQQIAALTAKQASLQAEITNLPGQINQAQVSYQQAETALAGPKREYTSAASSAAILESQYTSAYNNRVAYIGCKTLEMFGFRGPGSCGASNDAQYFSIKSRFESARARADSLWSAYQVRYSDYKSKYDRYKALFDRQASARNELASTSAEVSSANAALNEAEAHLAASHDANKRLQEMRAALTRWETTAGKIEELSLKGLGASWDSQFNRIAKLQGILQLHQNSVSDSFAVFRALTADLPDPDPQPSESTAPQVGEEIAGTGDNVAANSSG